MSEPKRVELRLTAEEIAALNGRQLVALDHVEACTSCEETFTFEEQQLFDPQDNDHCPRCGDRGSLTTYYGDNEYARIQENDLGDPGETFVSVLLDPERNELREEHAALVAAVRAAVAFVEAHDTGDAPHYALPRLSEALASDLVQRALKRDTESAPRAESEET